MSIRKDLLENIEIVFKRREYNIPQYQRGYKWSADQVDTILNDIKRFQESEKKIPSERFYCLQNITITKQANNKDAVYDEEYTIDLCALVPMVSKPHMPDNVQTIKDSLM